MYTVQYLAKIFYDPESTAPSRQESCKTPKMPFYLLKRTERKMAVSMSKTLKGHVTFPPFVTKYFLIKYSVKYK